MIERNESLGSNIAPDRATIVSGKWHRAFVGSSEAQLGTGILLALYLFWCKVRSQLSLVRLLIELMYKLHVTVI